MSSRLLRRLWMLLLLVWFLFGGLFLVLRWVVVPQIGEYRDEIAAELSRVSGLPVTIGMLNADWSGLRPRLHLAGLEVSDAAGRPALRLEQVDATLAWTSLLRLGPYFHLLEIVGPAIEARREADGSLLIGGLRVDGDGEDGGFADWLLAQRKVVVRKASLSWTDMLRGAPPLQLHAVEFSFEQGLRHQRFALRAEPPAELASALDVRGELRRFDAKNPGETIGRLYVGLERADLGGWAPWVDYPLELSGQGGLSLWLDAKGAESAELSADLALDSVVSRLAPGLPELQLERLDGHFVGRRSSSGFEVQVRRLALTTGDGVVLAPTDFGVRVQHAFGGKPAEGALTANELDFAALARLAAHLPLDDSVRVRLAAFDPQGQVRDLVLDWKGEIEAPSSWKLAARFDRIGLAAREALPGVGGLSGEIDGNDQGGRFLLAGRDTHVDLPDVFENSRLLFSAFKADGGWTRRDGRLEIALDSAAFDNVDAAGTAAGRYWLEPGGAGEIDLSARLTRADGAAVWRYLPRVINRDTQDWVRSAIRTATVPDVRFKLKGRLADFPFRDGNGQFLVAIKVANGRLAYAPDWPPIEAIDGEVRFEGPGMSIEANRGRIFGVNLSKVVAIVPDLDLKPSETMTLTGIASGPTADFLRFVNESPVARRIDGFTDHMRAEGNGTLDLKLVMPLRSVLDTAVTGEYRFSSNRLWVIDGLPPMEEAAGRLRFTADELSIPEARARLFGEPVQLSAVTTADSKVGFKVRGGLSVAAVRAALDWPALDHLSGTSGWSTDISVGREGTRVEIRSELDGVGSSLPYPLNKGASERWPLAVDLVFPAGGVKANISAKLADRVEAALERGANGTITGGGVGVFQPVRMAEKGILIAAKLDQLDVDAWRRALEAASEDGQPAQPGAAAAGLPLAGVVLEVQRLQAFGQQFNALKLRAVSDEGGWKARLDSTEAQGEFDWREAGDGILAARFRRLTVGGSASDPPSQSGAPEDTGHSVPPRRLPGLDVRIEQFSLGERALGKLEVLARNRNGEWWLERFALVHPDGRLGGNGVWRPGAEPRTQLDFVLETADIGRFTHALGYPDVVRGGRATMGGQLAWRGAPTAIDYPTLAGKLDLDAEKGQFNQLEPGVGRLLGILSLQALPRRITLDFRDVFSQGFAFDRISGSIDVAAGVMSSKTLEIRGPAARVLMRGTADIAAETQNLRVTVQPTLSESIAIGAAAGLINPVAGVITYLAQKALSDPIEKLFAYDYAITGSWSDPVVEKLASPVGGLIPSLPDSPPPAGAK